MSGLRVLVISAGIAVLSAFSSAQTPAEEEGEKRGSGMEGMTGSDSASGRTSPVDSGGCDVMCRGMMEMEMQRWSWMAPFVVAIGLLGTTALALLVALEVLWVRHWLRRVREPAPSART